MSFSNETINATDLPKHEEVTFTALDSAYKKVLMINAIILLLIYFAASIAAYNFIPDFGEEDWYIIVVPGVIILIYIVSTFIGFIKKGYAFREHDVLFRSGIIATHTMVIPYNRVQHVAVHEGALPRIFGLAEIQIFTAGGGTGDIGIPGIKKELAEDIKQLLMGKIQKQLS